MDLKILSPDQKKDFPAVLGFKMPAEWTPHEATWLAWPHNQETWPGWKLKKVQKLFLRMMTVLLEGEKVRLLVPGGAQMERITLMLKKNGANLKNFYPYEVQTRDAWIRDYGPTFLVKRRRGKAWCKWNFNGWGGKYPDLAEDGRVFEGPGNPAPGTCFKADLNMEGGAIEVNGEGVCLVTESCLLNRNRNPLLSRTGIESRLKNFLGIKAFLWLKGGLAGDDTDGHIDNLARFVNPDTVAACFEENGRDVNYKPLKANWDRLARASAGRKKINRVKLPMPGPLWDGRNRLPASYANFYIANRAVLVPAYRHSHDDRAKKILQELFPGRKVIAIDCVDLVYGLGSIHCVTQQEPA